MDITTIAVFIGGGSVVATLVTAIFKKAFAKVSAKYGAIVAQVLLLVVSVAISFLVFGAQFVPAEILAAAGAIFAGAMVIYEVFYKAIYQQTIKGKK